MRRQVQAFIVTDNLAELWVEGEMEPRYALHGSVRKILDDENLELIGVWQCDQTGGLEGCLKDRYIQWTVFDGDFKSFLTKLEEARQRINNDRKIRHNTCIRVYHYSANNFSVHSGILDAAAMNKFQMFLDGSWMVSPHIPMGPGQIIASLKEFQPSEGETLSEVCMVVTGATQEDVRTIFDTCGEIMHYHMAERLAAVTGMSASWWVNKSFEYQEALFKNDLQAQIKMYKLRLGEHA